jgi:hypothetical protein
MNKYQYQYQRPHAAELVSGLSDRVVCLLSYYKAVVLARKCKSKFTYYIVREVGIFPWKGRPSPGLRESKVYILES